MQCNCGATLADEEAEEGMCSSCMWAEEMAFLEAAYQADLDAMAESEN